MAKNYPPAVRRKLPSRRRSFTQKVRIGGQSVHMSVGEYRDGTPGEIFVDMHKAGSVARGFMHAIAISVSIGLQHGVPLAVYVKALTGITFEPNGVVDGSPYVHDADSVVDWLVKELETTYITSGKKKGANNAITGTG